MHPLAHHAGEETLATGRGSEPRPGGHAILIRASIRRRPPNAVLQPLGLTRPHLRCSAVRELLGIGDRLIAQAVVYARLSALLGWENAGGTRPCSDIYLDIDRAAHPGPLGRWVDQLRAYPHSAEHPNGKHPPPNLLHELAAVTRKPLRTPLSVGMEATELPGVGHRLVPVAVV
jgi:hypothetical protein